MSLRAGSKQSSPHSSTEELSLVPRESTGISEAEMPLLFFGSLLVLLGLTLYFG
jgi:hypothetical protein